MFLCRKISNFDVICTQLNDFISPFRIWSGFLRQIRRGIFCLENLLLQSCRYSEALAPRRYHTPGKNTFYRFSLHSEACYAYQFFGKKSNGYARISKSVYLKEICLSFFKKCKLLNTKIDRYVQRKIVFLLKCNNGGTWKIRKFGLLTADYPVFKYRNKFSFIIKRTCFIDLIFFSTSFMKKFNCKNRPNFCRLGIIPFQVFNLLSNFLFPILKLHIAS